MKYLNEKMVFKKHLNSLNLLISCVAIPIKYPRLVETFLLSLFVSVNKRINCMQSILKLQFIFKIWSYRIVFDVIKNVRKLFDDRMFNNLVIINLTFYSCIYLC